LIQEAIDRGDTDIYIMQVADYWLLVSIHFFSEKMRQKVQDHHAWTVHSANMEQWGNENEEAYWQRKGELPS